jgi:hypothetical protein
MFSRFQSQRDSGTVAAKSFRFGAATAGRATNFIAEIPVKIVGLEIVSQNFLPVC